MRRCGRCQLCCSRLNVCLGALGVVINLVAIFMLDSFTKVLFVDGEGELREFELEDTDTLYTIQIMKVVMSLLCVWVGVKGVKTFKPIVKEILHPQLFAGREREGQEKHSKRIRKFQKQYAKVMVATFVLMMLSIFWFKDYALEQAERFVDEEYDRFDQPTKYQFVGHHEEGIEHQRNEATMPGPRHCPKKQAPLQAQPVFLSNATEPEVIEIEEQEEDVEMPVIEVKEEESETEMVVEPMNLHAHYGRQDEQEWRHNKHHSKRGKRRHHRHHGLDFSYMNREQAHKFVSHKVDKCISVCAFWASLVWFSFMAAFLGSINHVRKSQALAEEYAALEADGERESQPRQYLPQVHAPAPQCQSYIPAGTAIN